MNIFYTNSDPLKCAQEHCLVHQNKMIVEYAQLLSTAHHVLDGKKALEGIYTKTHENHPSAVWVRASSRHYMWLHDVAMSLCQLYIDRTRKVHKSMSTLVMLSSLPKYIPDHGFTDPPIAAPVEFQINDVCEGYQLYLNFKFREWLSRDKPIQVQFWKQQPDWLQL